MKLYNVHIYREMRLYFPRIEAEAPHVAAKLAADKLTSEAEFTDDCDGENSAALIDVDGDDEFKQSITIDFEAERLRKAAPAQALVLDMVRYGRMTLTDGDAEFDGVTYWFDHQNPDWTAMIDAIGWEKARAAIAQAETA